MTNYSVRKPYTVFVAVVAIFVFGIISYLRMTPDLMPNMDYPYVVVVTTYPGAAPEEVEAVVAKPMEQVMATLNDIKSIQSTSAENYAMVLLEFEQETNMDSAMVDILQAVQRLDGEWDDTVGTPSIIRINPNMIPVMVAAVDSPDMDRYELASFARNTLMPALEGTTGLASVTAGGLVERTLTIKVTDEKLDALNERVAAAIDKSLDEARQQLADAQKEIDDARAAVNAGTAQLQYAPSAISGGMQQQAAEIAGMMEEAQDLAGQIAAAQAARAAVAAQLELSEADEQRLQQELNGIDSELGSLRGDKALYDPLLQEPYASMDGATSLRDESLGLSEDTIAALEAKGCYTLEAVRLQASLADARISVLTAQRETTAASLEVTRGQTESLRQQLQQADQVLEALENTSAEQLESLEALREQLQQLPSQILSGVTQISLAGGQLAAAQQGLTAAQQQLDQAVTTLEDQLSLALKTADMHAIVTLDALSNILKAQDFDMPAGYVYDDNGNPVIVTVGDAISGLRELEVLSLFDPGIPGLEPIRLRDVADIVLSDNAGEIYATLNGNDGLLLIFSKQSNYATARVSDNLRSAFKDMEGRYGVTFTPLMDQGDYIYLIRDSILSSLGWGVVFSVLVLLLFLRDWRPTVITLFSIPVSLMATLTMMYFANVSINMMSLSGLAISVGMLVDNSVVVIENTYRLRNLGESTMKAAVSGARQVGGAVAASTLTTVCVFVPIAFVSGLTRELFTDMILTLSFALIASLVVALTLVPALAGTLLAKARPPRESLFTRLMPVYRKSVLWAVSHKAVVILLAVAMLAGSGYLVLDRGFTFMPNMEMEHMIVTLAMPEDSSFAETAAMSDLAVERMLSVDGVETVGGSIGESYGMNVDLFSGGEGDVTYYVLLRSGVKASAVAKEINARCADLDCIVKADPNSLMSNMLSAISGSGVTVRIYANDLDVLRTTADRAAERLAQVEGLTEITAGEEEHTPEIHFTVNKTKAAAAGLTVAQVYMEVMKALTGEAEVMTFQDGQESYTMSVELKDKETITPDYIRDLTITVTGRDGSQKTVALRDIVRMEETESLTTISRINQRRYLDVTAEVAEGYNVTKATDRAEEALSDMPLEGGAELVFTGERESIMSALKDLLLLLIVGVLLVYLVMVGQFQNLKAPFIVMFTIPLAFTGGFLALLICGMEINILSMLGMIMLVGIIVNNGIVLVDYINQLRLGGMERVEAIAESAVTRLRPILMTSITTVLGLLVMALGQSEATSLIQPLAVTCIGGLLYATLMTLYVVPVMYDIFSRRELYQVREEDLVLSDK